jgi:hypothetical protein
MVRSVSRDAFSDNQSFSVDNFKHEGNNRDVEIMVEDGDDENHSKSLSQKSFINLKDDSSVKQAIPESNKIQSNTSLSKKPVSPK